MGLDYGGIANAGNEILSAVTKAVDSGDYSKLGTEISQSIGAATMDIAGQVRGNKINRDSEKRAAATARNMAQQSSNFHTLQHYQKVNVVKSPKQAREITPFMSGRSGKGTGVAEYVVGLTGTIVGSLGVAATAIAGVVGVVTLPAWGVVGFIPCAIFGAFTAASAIFMFKGKKKKSLFEKYREYGRLIGPAEFISIELLAAKAKLSKIEVLNDLRDFKKQGLLPKARLDEEETTLMLTDSSFQQYQEAEENRRLREMEESKWNTVGQDANEYQRRAAKALIDEGEKYIAHIRERNSVIPDAEMTDKLNRLESILHRIFDKVRQQPQSAKELRRFMDYYLPTTDKLISAYVDLDKQPEGLENVDKTKADIRNALEQINDGFEKLLNSMFEDLAMDISSDISVMNTMMKQDGLVEEDNAMKPDSNTNGYNMDIDLDYKPTLKL